MMTVGISSVDISPPVRLGTYRLERLLGRGGMGEVYLAWDERLERHVAIKRILSDPPPDARARTRFRREARAVARLSHPAIVQVFELLEVEDGDDCLVMEYVEGCGLAEWIAKGSLRLTHTLRLAAEIADGLAEAHAKGLIHRDLKPENIRITESVRSAPGRSTTGGAHPGRAHPGRAKILDFGLARLLWGEGLERDSLETGVTQSGALVGTVHAMSPEQASGRAVDHRSDLFALGSLLYEMLSGRAPFRGHNVLDTLRRITSEEPEPLSSLRPDLSLELVALVESLMAKQPEDRPQNARLVTDALERLRNSKLESAPEPAVLPSRPARATPRSGPVDAALGDLPTGEWPAPESDHPSFETVVRTLLLTDLVDSTQVIESLGDAQAAEISTRHDRVARDLLARHGGFEIDKSDGFLALFDRPFDAVAFALAYHLSLVELSREYELELTARVGIHLGEVRLRSNSPEDISRGAKPLEVEGLARPTVARLMGLAGARQTLLTHGVFDLARRSAVDDERWDEDLEWLAHGGYLFQGVEEPMEVYEVGIVDFAPLKTPPNSQKARRTVSFSEELVLGWRPAGGQLVPRRTNWVLKERLGEGGFGEVWLAEHESGEKRVFKFCFEASRLRGLKREVTLFRLLKEALGHRDDIARVLDWNFDAAPYFLEAEHTEGGDLTSWAELQGGLHKVPLATRVELVAQVADALAAAHSVGVLHKDIKPENVLVTHAVDGRPRIRLTDFGVGTLVDRAQLKDWEVPALGFTVTTAEEVSAAGSRLYLAPELLEGRLATVQADLFSLGVLLYQGVVGDFSRALAPGWQRGVGEELLVEDISLLVDGSPERRLAGAAVVAERLRALEERRQMLQANRLEERRRKQFRFASVVGAVLLVMVSGLLVQADFARRQAEELRGRAEVAREQAEGLIGFMLGELQGELQAIGRLGALEGAGEKALEYFEGLEEKERTVETVAQHAKALHQMGDVKMAQGDLEGALVLFQQSLRQTEGLWAELPENMELLFELGQSHFWVGAVHWRQGDLENAKKHLQSYLNFSEQLLLRQPEEAEWMLEVASGHSNLGDVHLARDNSGLAQEHYFRATQFYDDLIALDPTHEEWRFEAAAAHLRLGKLQAKEGRLAEALEQRLEAIGLLEELVSEDKVDIRWLRRLAMAQDNTTWNQLILGDLDGADSHRRQHLSVLKRLVAVDSKNTEWRYLLALAHAHYGQLLEYKNHPQEARDALQQAIGMIDSLPLDLASALDREFRSAILGIHATQLSRQDELERAEATARRAVEWLQPIVDGASTGRRSVRILAEAKLTLGEVLTKRGAHRDARLVLEQARDFMLSVPSRAPSDIWLLMMVHLQLGEHDRALPLAHTLVGLGFRHPTFLENCAVLNLNF